MMSQLNPTIPPSNEIPLSFKPLLESNYEMLFFSHNFKISSISSWDIRGFQLNFDQNSINLKLLVTGLLSPYKVQQWREIKYIKLNYISDEEETPLSTETFEILSLTGSTQGDYSSDKWLHYEIDFKLQ